MIMHYIYRTNMYLFDIIVYYLIATWATFDFVNISDNNQDEGGFI